MEWDGRSDDPSRSHIRQFDEPHSDAARRSIWMTGWANRNFSSTTDQTTNTWYTYSCFSTVSCCIFISKRSTTL